MSDRDEMNGRKTGYSSRQKKEDFWLGFLGGFGLMLVMFLFNAGISNLTSSGSIGGLLDLAALAAVLFLIIYLIRIKRYFYIFGGLVSLVALPLLVFGACLAVLGGGLI